MHHEQYPVFLFVNNFYKIFYIFAMYKIHELIISIEMKIFRSKMGQVYEYLSYLYDINTKWVWLLLLG